jgi:hypothetical protein
MGTLGRCITALATADAKRGTVNKFGHSAPPYYWGPLSSSMEPQAGRRNRKLRTEGNHHVNKRAPTIRDSQNIGVVSYAAWFMLMRNVRRRLLAGDTETVEIGVQQLLLELGGSHIACYHESANGISAAAYDKPGEVLMKSLAHLPRGVTSLNLDFGAWQCTSDRTLFTK